MSDRRLYVFAKPEELQDLAAFGLPELCRGVGLDAATTDRRCFGFALEEVRAIVEGPDAGRVGLCFNPLLEPQSASDRPLRVLLWQIHRPADLDAALGWWDQVLSAWEKLPAAQADAPARLDATVLVFHENPTPDQRRLVAAAGETRGIYLIGPVHRVLSNRNQPQVKDSWRVEIPRLIAALLSSPKETPADQGAGLWAWSSVAFEVQVDGKRPSVQLGVDSLRARLRPNPMAWDGRSLGDRSRHESSTYIDPVSFPAEASSPLPAGFLDWPPAASSPVAVQERVQLDSRPWQVSRERIGQAHRQSRDQVDLVEGASLSTKGQKETFTWIRQDTDNGENSFSRLSGVANTAQRVGDTGSKGGGLEDLNRRWNELVDKVDFARRDERAVNSDAGEVGRARLHLPPFHWRLLIAGAVTLFTGALSAFAIAMTPKGSLVNLLVVCGLAAGGAALGIALVWMLELRAGRRASDDVRRRVNLQMQRITEAAAAAGAVVSGGIGWWGGWRFDSLHRNVRLLAKRADRCVDVALAQADLGAHLSSLRSAHGGSIRYASATTIVVKATGDRAAPEAGQDQEFDGLSRFEAFAAPDAAYGAIDSARFLEELKQRIDGFLARHARTHSVRFEVSADEWRRACAVASSRLTSSDAGGVAATEDFPGLSVVTARRSQPSVNKRTHLLVRESTMPEAEVVTQHLDPTVELDAVQVCIIQVSVPPGAESWQEGSG